MDFDSSHYDMDGGYTAVAHGAFCTFTFSMAI